MNRSLRAVVSVLFLATASITFAQTKPVADIPFTQETLPNGLHVIYAPLHQAPVVHVRVLYHVGSRDERPDRQGFAHMFEHMMFRGSAHVAPQQHMKMVNDVGGYSNAFTSFDQTCYVDTVPAEDLPMVLYLEADRMSSFKVSEEIYKTERKVVAEEWRIKQNKPYGNLFEDLSKNVFTTHSYRWTPIGNMQHLLNAPVSELQDFYNTYYVPNNATLIISGDIDPAKSMADVHRYFGWIPQGAPVPRHEPVEPPQTQARSVTVPDRVPLPAVIVAYHLPVYQSDDTYALSILSSILAGSDDSRLPKLLVNSDHPLCLSAETINEQLEDGGIFGVLGTVLQGKSTDDVTHQLAESLQNVIDHGVSEDEVARAKTDARVSTIKGRETAEQIGTQLGAEAVFGGDPNRVNTELAKLDAVTPAQIQAVAKKYLNANQATTLLIKPDPLGTGARKAAAAAMAMTRKDAPVAASTEPVHARDVHFPAGYPTTPPIIAPSSSAHFDLGQSSDVDGAHVVVLTDHRLPLVNWSLTLRRGSHSDPAGKEGLASIMGDMLGRGAGDRTFDQINRTLSEHGISVSVTDGGDYTRFEGSSTTAELNTGIAVTRDELRSPTFPAAEFTKLKEQTLAGLLTSLESPRTAVERDMLTTLFAGTPLGHPETLESVGSITLEDIKHFYASEFGPKDSILIVAGDVAPEQGVAIAHTLLDGWMDPSPAQVAYPPLQSPSGRRIILIDRPGAAGSTIRIGIPAYDIHDDQKFAGSLAGSILSSGIESRLGQYVRAEKGYVYGVTATFSPRPARRGIHRKYRHPAGHHGRHAGSHVQGLHRHQSGRCNAGRAVGGAAARRRRNGAVATDDCPAGGDATGRVDQRISRRLLQHVPGKSHRRHGRPGARRAAEVRRRFEDGHRRMRPRERREGPTQPARQRRGATDAESARARDHAAGERDDEVIMCAGPRCSHRGLIKVAGYRRSLTFVSRAKAPYSPR